VQWDALNEYISIKTARNVYGVVLNPKTFAVDEKGTAALRTRLKTKKGTKAKAKKGRSKTK
jgi:hypothetical protein